MRCITDVIPRIHVNQAQVVVVFMAGEALVGQLMAWLNAPVAERQIVGVVGYFGPIVGVALPVAHDAGGAEVVAVDVEQAVVPFYVAADAGGDGFAA